MVVRISIVLVAALVLSACAGPNPPSPYRKMQLTSGVIELIETEDQVSLSDPRIKCTQITAVGSRFPVRTCALKSELDEQRVASLRDFFGADDWGARTSLGSERANEARRSKP